MPVTSLRLMVDTSARGRGTGEEAFEGVADGVGVLDSGLHVEEAELGGKLLSLLALDLPAQLVHLVAHQPDLHVRLGLVQHCRQPLVHVLETLPVAHVEHDECAHRLAVVAA